MSETGRDSRLARARAAAAARDLDALLVTKPPNVTYLSGFAGSAGALLISAGNALLVSDFRYQTQAREEAPGFAFFRSPRNLAQGLAAAIADLAERSGSRRLRVGFEAQHLTCATRDELHAALARQRRVSLEAAGELVEQLRLRKEPAELEAIRRAARITDAAFEHVRGLVRPGVTERELAIELDYFMKRQGADRLAFDPVVASGPRGALPHAKPTDRPVAPGDLIVFDLGASVNGYSADLSRTVALGPVADQPQEIYRLVWEAQRRALEALGPGRTGRQVDEAARAYLNEAGFGAYFGHGLGHGVGLETHEAPRLAPEAETVLAPGMVVTVEPGLYLPGLGGVRIEDLCFVTEEGAEIVSTADKPARLPVVG
jgi:Xaa-Pro aminopeptidase